VKSWDFPVMLLMYLGFMAVLFRWSHKLGETPMNVNRAAIVNVLWPDHSWEWRLVGMPVEVEGMKLNEVNEWIRDNLMDREPRAHKITFAYWLDEEGAEDSEDDYLWLGEQP